MLAQQGIEQRFLPETVASSEHEFLVAVVKNESKHAVNVLHALRSERQVRVDDAFGVAVRSVTEAALLEILLQSGVVVDFAVEDDDHGTVCRVQRLLPRQKVDNREAAMTEADEIIDVRARCVRAAMGKHVAHTNDDVAARTTDDPADPAHGRSYSPFGSIPTNALTRYGRRPCDSKYVRINTSAMMPCSIASSPTSTSVAAAIGKGVSTKSLCRSPVASL